MRFVKFAAAAALLWALTAAPALASNCPAFTYTLTNGTTADANQVMSNFNTLLNCSNNSLAHNAANSDITSLTGLTTPLSVPQGGTGLGTLTAHAVPLGNGTSAPNFATIGTAGNVLTDNGAGADPTFQAPASKTGATTFLANDVALNNTANFFAGPDTGSIGANGQVWDITAIATVVDTAGSGVIECEIYDGSAAVADIATVPQNGNFALPIPLEVVVTLSAATTYTLQCKDQTSTSGKILTTGSATTAHLATQITAKRMF